MILIPSNIDDILYYDYDTNVECGKIFHHWNNSYVAFPFSVGHVKNGVSS